jgi:hypothetical protein
MLIAAAITILSLVDLVPVNSQGPFLGEKMMGKPLMQAEMTQPSADMSRKRRSLFSSLGWLTAGPSPWGWAPSVEAAQAGTTPRICVNLVGLLDKFASEARGFEMSDRPHHALSVFIAFDPQCPECVDFWRAAMPLRQTVRFVWLPVAILNPLSEPQGAELLSAASPATSMERHVASFKHQRQGQQAAWSGIWRPHRVFPVLRKSGSGAFPWRSSRTASSTRPIVASISRSAARCGISVHF